MTVAGLLRRSGAGLLSQILNSGSNLLLSVVIAREVVASDYGGWAIGYALFVMLLAVNRAVVSTPVLIHRESAEGVQLRESLRDSVSAAAALGAISGLLLVAAGLLIDGPLGAALLALGLFMPGLLVHDTLRYGYFKEGRPSSSATLDLTWVLFQVIFFGAVILMGEASVFTLTASWGAGATVGAVAGLVRRRWSLRLNALRSHIARNRWEGPRLLTDAVLTTVAANALPAVVGAVVGLAASGYLRAGQTLMGIVGLVVMGLTPIMTAEAVKILESGHSAWRILWGWSLVVGVLGVTVGGSVLLLPDSIGEEILGDSWSGAKLILLPLVLQVVVRGPFTGVPMILKASSRLDELVRLRVKVSVVSLAVPAACAVVGGLSGAAWGVLAAAIWANLQCVFTLRKVAPEGTIASEQ